MFQDIQSGLRVTILLVITSCAILIGGQAAAQQKNLPAWFNVPEDESGVVLFVSGEVENLNFLLRSGDLVLDQAVWTTSLPFVKQYRLTPGNYKIQTLNSEDDLLFTAYPGKLSFLKYEVISKEKLYFKLHDYKVGLDPFHTWSIDYTSKYFDIGEWKDVFKHKDDWYGAIWPIEYITVPGKKLQFVPDRRPPPPPK